MEIDFVGEWKNISSIGLGCAGISGRGGGYGFGDISESDSIELLEKAFEAGVKVFDTAPVYGFGISEKRLGRAFCNNAKEVCIVTKGGIDWTTTKRIYKDNSPETMRRMFFESLERLKLDRIDVYLIHWPDNRVDIREPWEILMGLKREGLVLHLGLSNPNVDDIKKVQEMGDLEVLQGEHNAFTRRCFQSCSELPGFNTLHFMGYGTLHKGILTGRVTEEREKNRDYDPWDLRSWAPWWKSEDKAWKIRAIARLRSEFGFTDEDLLNFALASSVIREPGGHIALCGARTPRQIHQILSQLSDLDSFNLQRVADEVIHL